MGEETPCYKMDKQNVTVKILIDFEEYNLLIKKAELYDKSLDTKLQIGGSSLDQIVAENSAKEGLLQPEAPSELLFILAMKF